MYSPLDPVCRDERVRMRAASSVAGAIRVAVLAVALATGCSLFDLFSSKADAPDVLWHVTGSGISMPAYDGTTVFFLTTDHRVLALDAATGEQRWEGRTYPPGVGVTFGHG